jgi:hypothetical protein
VAPLVALLTVVTKGTGYGGRLVNRYDVGSDAYGRPIDFTG